MHKKFLEIVSSKVVLIRYYFRKSDIIFLHVFLLELNVLMYLL